MEFTADASKFAKALEQIQGAVDKKNTMPILSHCLVEAEPQGLRMAATDLELGIRLFCPAEVKEAGSGAIPARRLLDIVQSLGDGEVRVRAIENYWIRITCGRSTFKLAAMARDNFPSMPEVPPSLCRVPAATAWPVVETCLVFVSPIAGCFSPSWFSRASAGLISATHLPMIKMVG